LRFGLILLASIVFAGEPSTEFALGAEPGQSDAEWQNLLARYLEAQQKKQNSPRDVSMHVAMEASLPSLSKQGSMKGQRTVSKAGQVGYAGLEFTGDNTIKKDVIARYLSAEVEAAGKGGDISINERNYKFKYWGKYGEGNWRLHLFEVAPKQKRVGLFVGWVWVEESTALPVREQGRFVKNPSIFLRSVTFIRDYEIHAGMAYPVRINSTVETRLVGKAELAIRYLDYGNAPATASSPPQ
jgi:hypothetical protein